MATSKVAQRAAPTRAGLALARLLEDADDAAAKKIRLAVHRTMLWRYMTGRRQPDADTIAKLSELSNGRIPADGWGERALRKKAS